MLRNFLWGGTKHMVKWSDCCTKKAIGGLGLIDLEEAIKMLICEEMTTTLETGESNLK
jgi:hypothetical protein